MSKQLLKSTAVVGGMTMVSRILGFIRDMVAAHFFGASFAYDAFIVASKIPNFMRRLFAEGAFSQAFVPILSEYHTQKSHEEVQAFVDHVFGCLTAILLVVTILGIVIAPLLVMLFAPGFAVIGEGSRLTLAVAMLQITFPYLFCVSLTAFAGGILNCYGRFAVPAFTPVFLNISLIIATIFVSQYLKEPVTALAWGFLVGGIIQLLFQLPFLKRIKLLPRPKLSWKDPGVRRILWLMVPSLLGVSVTQLNLMLSSIFASFLPVGSVSWLYYAERLMEFPMGAFGVALATVVLPRLSRHHAKAESDHFSVTLDWGVRWTLLIGLPATLGLALLAGPLLTTLFQSGKFTDQDVIYSQSCLIAYSFGIMGFMLIKIFGSAFYAKQDIKTPVRIAMMTVVANAIFSAVLVGPFNHTGLAVATSVAALLNGVSLGYILLRRKVYQIQPGWGGLFIRLILALSAMAAVIMYWNPTLEQWFTLKILDRVITLSLLIGGSTLAYIGTLFATGMRVDHVLMKATES